MLEQLGNRAAQLRPAIARGGARDAAPRSAPDASSAGSETRTDPGRRSAYRGEAAELARVARASTSARGKRPSLMSARSSRSDAARRRGSSRSPTRRRGRTPRLADREGNIVDGTHDLAAPRPELAREPADLEQRPGLGAHSCGASVAPARDCRGSSVGGEVAGARVVVARMDGKLGDVRAADVLCVRAARVGMGSQGGIRAGDGGWPPIAARRVSTGALDPWKRAHEAPQCTDAWLR